MAGITEGKVIIVTGAGRGLGREIAVSGIACLSGQHHAGADRMIGHFVDDDEAAGGSHVHILVDH